MLGKFGFSHVSLHLGHQSSRLRSSFKPNEHGQWPMVMFRFFYFWTLTQTDFFTQLKQILKLTQPNYVINFQFWKNPSRIFHKLYWIGSNISWSHSKFSLTQSNFKLHLPIFLPHYFGNSTGLPKNRRKKPMFEWSSKLKGDGPQHYLK